MKRTLLALFLVSNLLPFSQAQTTSEAWSTHIAMHTLAHLRNAAGTSYLLMGDKNDYPSQLDIHTFQTADDAPRLLSVKLPEGPGYATEYLGAFLSQDQLTLVATYQQKSASGPSTQVKAYTIGDKGIEKESVLMELPHLCDGDACHVRMSVSPSGTHMSLMAEYPEEIDQNEKLRVMAFDSTLSPVIDKEVTLDVAFKRTRHNYAFCNNAGMVYVLKKDRDKGFFNYRVYGVNENTEAGLSKSITIPGNKRITDIRASINEAGQFIVGGFYSSQPIREYEGHFLFAFDAAMNFVFKSFSRLDARTLELGGGKRAVKEGVIGSHYIHSLHALPDGHHYLLAEEISKSDKDDSKIVGNILAIHLDQNGKFKSSFTIAKQQSLQKGQADYVSFQTTPVSDTVYLWFNAIQADVMNKLSKNIVAGKTLAPVYVCGLTSAKIKQPTVLAPELDTDDHGLLLDLSSIHSSEKGSIMVLSSPDQKIHRVLIYTTEE